MKKYEQADPESYGLTKKAELVKIGKNHIGIVKMRKSRIIMADGKKLLEIADKIIKKEPDVKISIITNAPVCSKTTAFLKEHNINFIS
jgi:hypothetical protein